MMTPIRKIPSQSCMDCPHRSFRMFCNLEAGVLADFDAIGVPVMLPKGAVLFQEGDAGNRVTLVCSGQVKLSCTSKEGKTLILKVAVPGDVLGLSAVISGSPFEVSAETLEPVVAKSVRGSDFLSFLERHREAGSHTATALSQEYKTAFFDARRLALSSSVAARVASLFLDWGTKASCDKPEMRFTMALTHEDLANLAGTTRETITRALGKFQKDRIIQVRGASIHVLQPEVLARIAV